MTHGTKYLRYKIRNDGSSFNKFRELGSAKVKSFIIFIVFVSVCCEWASVPWCVCVVGEGQRATQSSLSHSPLHGFRESNHVVRLAQRALNLLSYVGGN